MPKTRQYDTDRRFDTPDDFKKYKSRYDFDSDELQNLVRSGVSGIYTEVVDLSTARSPNNPYIIGSGGVTSTQNNGRAGRAIEMKGITTATQYNFSTNTGIETVATAALINIWVNKIGGPSEFLAIKNGDGYRGDFAQIFAFWPAQSSTSMRIVIYQFDDMPWMSGDFST